MRNVNIVKGKINQLHMDILRIRKLKVNGIGHFQPNILFVTQEIKTKKEQCYFHSNKVYNINRIWVQCSQ